MASFEDLLYCKKCNMHYPDVYFKCPQCGTQLKKKKSAASKAITAVGIVLVAAAVVLLLFLVYNQTKRAEHYQLGKNLMAEGKYVEAQTAFGIAGDHEDAAQLLEEAKKGEHYQLGQTAFDKHDYETAVEEFTAAENFEGAAFMLGECHKALHFIAGEEAYAAGDMDKAIEEFSAADDWPGATGKLTLAKQRKSFNEGVALMDRGDYAAAIGKLEEADNFTGAKENIQKCYYQLGKAQAEAGNYEEALKLLAQAGGNNDVRQLQGECSLYVGKDMLAQGNYAKALEYMQKAKGTADHLEPQLENYLLLCKAEAAFSTGELTEGVELYGQIPQTFKPAEFDIAARRNAMYRISSFAKLEGEFTSTNYNVQIIGEGYIHSYRKGSIDDQSITIKCTLNPDGTLNIEGSAFFYVFRSLPFMGYGTKASERVEFKIENIQWVPGTYAIDEHTMLYFNNGTPKITYNNSVEGKYPTSSTVTYNVRK